MSIELYISNFAWYFYCGNPTRGRCRISCGSTSNAGCCCAACCTKIYSVNDAGSFLRTILSSVWSVPVLPFESSIGSINDSHILRDIFALRNLYEAFFSGADITSDVKLNVVSHSNTGYLRFHSFQ